METWPKYINSGKRGRGTVNKSRWRSQHLQSRVETVGSTGAREDPGGTPVFRRKAVDLDGKHCPRQSGDGVPTGPDLSGA